MVGKAESGVIRGRFGVLSMGVYSYFLPESLGREDIKVHAKKKKRPMQTWDGARKVQTVVWRVWEEKR